MLVSRAATPFISAEGEDGAVTGCARPLSDTTASEGRAVKFSSPADCAVSAAGAQLPITYNLASLNGPIKYVATTGSDTTGTGTAAAPYASLSRAISAAADNDAIVIRGGTYRQGDIVIPAAKSLRIMAYPGEIPVFNGADAAATGWATEGLFKYHAYAPQPVVDGYGITFSTGMNLNGDGVGKFSDQAWVGTATQQQVTTKAAVVAGKFWVDRTNSRLYMTAADVDRGGIEYSSKDVFMNVNAPNSSLEGIRITRFSSNPGDGAALRFLSTADFSVVRNVEVSETSFIAVSYAGGVGGSDILTDGLMQNVTLRGSNWMGVSPVYTDRMTFDKMLITGMNPHNEFSFSPQSGAIKTSRTRQTKVLNSDINNNNSHGIWFDQSNIDADIADNHVTDNSGTGVFYEISHDILLIDNYIDASAGQQAVKLAGSSGLKLVNNTLLGGRDPVGIYVDSRSKPGCANPTLPLCAGANPSSQDTIRPYDPDLTWIPSLDLMINNILAYPAVGGLCGTTVSTGMCITDSNQTATVPLQTVIHQANASRGLPRTQISGNVYANGTGNIIRTPIGNYTTTAAFATAMAAAPVNIAGFEANGRTGNSWVAPTGTPTPALSAVHAEATPLPTDVDINQYLAPNTRHFGVTRR